MITWPRQAIGERRGRVEQTKPSLQGPVTSTLLTAKYRVRSAPCGHDAHAVEDLDRFLQRAHSEEYRSPMRERIRRLLADLLKLAAVPDIQARDGVRCRL